MGLPAIVVNKSQSLMVETKLQKSGQFSEHNKSEDNDRDNNENPCASAKFRESENIEYVMQQVNS